MIETNDPNPRPGPARAADPWPPRLQLTLSLTQFQLTSAKSLILDRAPPERPTRGPQASTNLEFNSVSANFS